MATTWHHPGTVLSSAVPSSRTSWITAASTSSWHHSRLILSLRRRLLAILSRTGSWTEDGQESRSEIKRSAHLIHLSNDVRSSARCPLEVGQFFRVSRIRSVNLMGVSSSMCDGQRMCDSLVLELRRSDQKGLFNSEGPGTVFTLDEPQRKPPDHSLGSAKLRDLRRSVNP